MITILIISTITFIILFIYQIFKFITIKIKTRNQIQKIKRQIRDFENDNRRSLDLTYNDNPLFNMVMLSNYETTSRASEHALETQAMIIPVPVYNNLQVKKYQNFSGRPVYYEQRPSCGLILDEEDERNNSNPSYVGLDVRPTVGARVDEISRI